MTRISFRAFGIELQKSASSARSAAELLAQRAAKKGISPSMLPALKQVSNAAAGGKEGRGRAAEIALNVRKYLQSAA